MDLEQKLREALSPEWEVLQLTRVGRTRVGGLLRRCQTKGRRLSTGDEYLSFDVKGSETAAFGTEDALLDLVMDRVRQYERESAAKHPVRIESHSDLKKLAREVANLRYDALQEFLSALRKELQADRKADEAKGRERLSEALYDAEVGIASAEEAIGDAWEICEPFEMRKEDG